MPSHLKLAAAALALTFALAAPAFAATVEVQLKNKGTDGNMVFEPSLVKIAPGDTVTFVPTDKGHNAETIPDMLPEGATPFKGQFSQEISVTFDKPGAYGVRCSPHYAMGMVALVVVGDVPPANLDAVKAIKQPALAQKRFDTIYSELGGAQ